MTAFVQAWCRTALAAERGAVLALTGLMLVILTVSGAMAVDLSSLERQGQTLQNTADAAALAGVAVWAETQDEAAVHEAVRDTVRLNGVQVGPDLQINVAFPSVVEVQVVLSDRDPNVFLAGVVGIGGTLERDATARLRICEDACTSTVEIPEPLTAVRVMSEGDGFLPIAVGDKLYAINRTANTINCIDRTTNEECWLQRTLFPFDDDPITMSITHTYVHGSRIFYLSWTGEGVETAERDAKTFLHLSCWETSTDTPCTESRFIRNAGQGSLIGTPDGLYVMAANLHVHCFDPDTLQERCGGYGGGGRVNELRKEGRGFDQYWANRMTNGDYVSIGDRFYFTASQDTGQVWLACWSGRRECRNFEAPPINDTGTTDEVYDDYSGGRLFLYRDTHGTPQAVCSIGFRVRIECFDPITADRHHGAEASMAVTTDRMQVNGSFIGKMTYHAPTNRVFLVSDHETSTTYCHDFTTGSFCGEYYNTSRFGPTEPYGYLAEADCLIGLGEPQIFFTLRPDMSGECDNTGIEVDITPCVCGGELVWPPISAWGLEGIETFEIRVLDPDGNVLIPESGAGWVNLGGDPLDLSVIEDFYDYLTVEVNVEPIDGEYPWIDGDVPRLVIGLSDLDPQLVE